MKAVNLLPADLKASKRSASGNRKPSPPRPVPVGALAVLGVLAAVVVAVAALVLAGNTVRERESRLAAVKAEQQAAAAQIGRLQAYGTFRRLAADRVSTVRDLAASRFDWEQALRDLSRAIPADVTLSNLTATVAPGARAGEASSANPLRAARAAPAIELTGCTRDQDSVARLMSRMRGVRGVTRVSLAGSTKEKATVSASSDGAGDEAPSGCGRGDKPAFQVVMFFERATGAGAATPAASAAAPAAASATPASGATPAADGTPAPAGSPDPAGTATPAGGLPESSSPAATGKESGR